MIAGISARGVPHKLDSLTHTLTVNVMDILSDTCIRFSTVSAKQSSDLLSSLQAVVACLSDEARFAEKGEGHFGMREGPVLCGKLKEPDN